jgi:hypothetical protein
MKGGRRIVIDGERIVDKGKSSGQGGGIGNTLRGSPGSVKHTNVDGESDKGDQNHEQHRNDNQDKSILFALFIGFHDVAPFLHFVNWLCCAATLFTDVHHYLG